MRCHPVPSPRHKRDCVGAITLGKDMVFRDYAQGAYRLRGIGKGQKLRILIIPDARRHAFMGHSFKNPSFFVKESFKILPKSF